MVDVARDQSRALEGLTRDLAPEARRVLNVKVVALAKRVGFVQPFEGHTKVAFLDVGVLEDVQEARIGLDGRGKQTASQALNVLLEDYVGRDGGCECDQARVLGQSKRPFQNGPPHLTTKGTWV